MTLKCTKSKSALFTTGRAYNVLAADLHEDDPESRIYMIETNKGSTCWTGLRGCQGDFTIETVYDHEL